MSTKSGSVSQSASKMQQNVRKVRKFKFTDLTLSYEVRKRLYEMLISFDDNINYEFQKNQIKKALQQILEESQAELAYVVNNVFRYDVNHDGVVTYQQFSNFCLEQHFGEMAIQRLHKNNLYSRGKERVMSSSQFVSTVAYCLSFIEVHPKKEALELIFRDVDLDRDDYITYSDYFILLKQYFGSQSQSANTIKLENVEEDLKKIYGNADKKAIKQQIFKQKFQKLKSMNENIQKSKQIKGSLTTTITQPVKPPKKSEEVVALGQRISRLVYHQLKIMVMDNDQKLQLTSDQSCARSFLVNSLNLSDQKARQIIQESFRGEKAISYEKLLKNTVERLMCSDLIEKLAYPVTKQNFVLEIHKNLFFVRAKPFSFLLEQLFQKFNAHKDEASKSQMKQLMVLLFGQYCWPRKTGEIRSKTSRLFQ